MMGREAAVPHEVDSYGLSPAYRRLADRLDALPHRFPRTEGGEELRLLAKLFTPEEAALAAALSPEPEPVEAIAARATDPGGAGPGPDARTAKRLLKGMAKRGLIRVERGEGELLFALMPFVVGFYEAQLPRMDAEFAELFEAYFQATHGLDVPGPSVHRVIPVGEAVRADVAIHPYEQAAALIEGAQSWAVQDCICRTQQKLVGAGCDRPVNNCLIFAPVPGVFVGGEGRPERPIGKEEALTILREAEDAGLVHTVGNFQNDHFYICNCCTCCCGVLRRLSEFAVPTAIARSAFAAEVDEGLCIGCGTCTDRCQFDAIAVPEGVAVVDAARCVGCGLCVTTCPVDALSLTRRPDADVSPPPIDRAAWNAARTAARS